MEKKRLTKSSSDKKICGVCGGIAKYLGCDSTLIRLIWAATVLCLGVGILGYFVAALILPNDEE